MNTVDLKAKLILFGSILLCDVNNEEGNVFLLVMENVLFESITEINNVIETDIKPIFINVDHYGFNNGTLKVQFSK